MAKQGRTQIEFELLVTYLAGQATPEEAMLVDEWLQQEDNKQAFSEWQAVWQVLEKDKYQKVYPARAWERMQPAIVNRPAMKKRWLYAAAAILIGLLFLIGITYKGSNNQNPVQNTVTLTAGATKKNRLPDGSTVVLKSHSAISYDADFNKKTRELKLEGEAYFSVAPDTQKPFIIQVGYAEIEVLGTVFNVKTLNSNEIEVQVQSGVVKLHDKNGYHLIRANQSGIFYKNGQMALFDSVNINALAYATGRLVFSKTPFTVFAEVVENRYGVEIDNKNLYRQCRITAELQDASLEEILQKACAQSGLGYTIQKNKVHISGAGCSEKTDQAAGDQYQLIQVWETNHPFTEKEKEEMEKMRNLASENVRFYEYGWNSIDGLNRFLSENSVPLTARLPADGRLAFQGKGALYFFGPASRSIVIITKNGNPCYFGTGDNLNLNMMAGILNLHDQQNRIP